LRYPVGLTFGRGLSIRKSKQHRLPREIVLPVIAAPAARPRLSSLHLKRLEAESIGILREAAAEFRNPVMLYSIGKDSSVMLHLARKAFFPGSPPFPLLHVDTGWKFRDMIAFRDMTVAKFGLRLIVHTNEEGVARGIDPIRSGSALHTQVMKTEALKQALDRGQFDAAFGGARRDEEKSRAKERVFSLRGAGHSWNPRNQRPELWHLYNTRLGERESVRVFPLSNWTELDVWEYIAAEEIPVVPLYFAAVRPVVRRQGQWIMVDDARLPLEPGEQPERRLVRFRSLGCYPLTAAIESNAASVPEIVAELRAVRRSERDGRLIDNDQDAAMERKKREGYF
jgi:sulfate adenylyltransferase subunit 2